MDCRLPTGEKVNSGIGYPASQDYLKETNDNNDGYAKDFSFH
jgi:hypothetical protein